MMDVTNFIVVIILNLYTYQIIMLHTKVNTMLYVNYISKKKKRTTFDMKLRLGQLAMAQDK